MNLVLALKSFFEAPPYRRGPVLLNRLGYQKFRVRLANAGTGALRIDASDPTASYKNALRDEGYCIVKDFLPADIFTEVEAAFGSYKDSANVRKIENKNGTGITWWEGIISRSRDHKEDADIILKQFADNPFILELASYVLGRAIRGPLTLGFQIMHCPANEIDDRDVEGVLHADRHFACVKAFFFVDDNEIENGAYVYCPGSHLLTQARVEAESKLAIQYQHWKKTKRIDSNLGIYERNYPALSPEDRRALGIREVAVTAPKNSLAISNNMGFHKRGVIQPGRTRKHIRILFYDEQAPLYGRLVKRLFKVWRDRER